jgi:hypothetical protein
LRFISTAAATGAAANANAAAAMPLCPMAAVCAPSACDAEAKQAVAVRA